MMAGMIGKSKMGIQNKRQLKIISLMDPTHQMPFLSLQQTSKIQLLK